MTIANLSKPKAANKDIKTFDLLEEGQISVGECLTEFRKHNSIPKHVAIPEGEFVEWLKSLGYLREHKPIEL